MQRFSRREFLAVTSSAAGAVALGCSLDTPAPTEFSEAQATLTARPAAPTIAAPPTGYSALGLTAPRDGFVYMPSGYSAGTPAPLLVLLHDAAGSAKDWENYAFGQLVDDLGVVVLAPDSRFDTWDLNKIGGLREDVAFLNGALTWLFQRVNIKASRVAIGGFGIGATESMAMGLANGSLFTHVLSFSPNAIYAKYVQGKPNIWISHGTQDGVFSSDYTKTKIVPVLQENGYTVNYVEYDAAHTLPTATARQSVQWFLT